MNPNGEDKTVLIVEDDKLNCKLFRDLLTARGYRTVETEDGGEVIEMVRKHRPDLIVMDVQLPRVSGIDLTRSLKADRNFSPIPVVAVTAFMRQLGERRLKDSGCDAMLSKPISIEHFLETVSELLA